MVVHVGGVPGGYPLFQFLELGREGAEFPGDFSGAHVLALPGGASEFAVAQDGVVKEFEVFEVVE